jgi:ankyrin
LVTAALAFAGDFPLISAIRSGDIGTVAALLRHGENSNTADPDGTTALTWAAYFNNSKIADLLIGAGANVSAVNQYGVTPLSEAAGNGNASLVETLLAAGADPNAASPGGETALMSATRSGSLEAVRLLLSHDASVDAKEGWRGQTALMWAAAGNHAAIAALLLLNGADGNAHSTVWPPEVKRPKNGNIVSDRPKGGLTPLLLAAREGALEAAKVMASSGADLNLADPDGITPVLIALINAHYDIAGYLLEAGANPNLADRYGRTALYAAIDMNTLEPSVTRPAPKDDSRLTALDVAAVALARGAKPDAALSEPIPGRGLSDDPDPVLRKGTTPFLRAAKTGDLAGMRLLLAHGANPQATTADGATALMLACGLGWRYGQSRVTERDATAAVNLLLDLGLSVNTANLQGETALHGAAERGAEELLKLLVDRGAKPDAPNTLGRTPLDIAAGNGTRGNPGYPKTLAILRELQNAHVNQ